MATARATACGSSPASTRRAYWELIRLWCSPAREFGACASGRHPEGVHGSEWPRSGLTA